MTGVEEAHPCCNGAVIASSLKERRFAETKIRVSVQWSIALSPTWSFLVLFDLLFALLPYRKSPDTGSPSRSITTAADIRKLSERGAAKKNTFECHWRKEKRLSIELRFAP
ncbi:hypothetical protein IAS59_004843 [Cryptococcus gattii]